MAATWQPGMPFYPPGHDALDAACAQPQAQPQAQPHAGAMQQQQQQGYVVWMLVGPDGMPCAQAGMAQNMVHPGRQAGMTQPGMVCAQPAMQQMQVMPPGANNGRPTWQQQLQLVPQSLAGLSKAACSAGPVADDAATGEATISSTDANPRRAFKIKNPSTGEPLDFVREDTNGQDATSETAPQERGGTLERQMMLASVRDQLVRNVVRRTPVQSTGQHLKHSTFSALNLEAHWTPKTASPSRKRTVAPLEEMRRDVARAAAAIGDRAKDSVGDGVASSSPSNLKVEEEATKPAVQLACDDEFPSLISMGAKSKKGGPKVPVMPSPKASAPAKAPVVWGPKSNAKSKDSMDAVPTASNPQEQTEVDAKCTKFEDEPTLAAVPIHAIPEKRDLAKNSPDMETRTPSGSASDHSKDDEEQDNEHVLDVDVHASEDEAAQKEVREKPSEQAGAARSDAEAAVDPQVLSREHFLQFCFLETKVPEELQTLTAAEHKTAWKANDAPDRSLFGSKSKIPKAHSAPEMEHSVLTVSENAYKIANSQQIPRLQQLKREVNSMVNKVCPENIVTIVEKVASTEVRSQDELELVISLIFKKALTEPHYCETYADMVFALKQRMPEFPSENGGKPVTFKTVLLNQCQNEFEALPAILKMTVEELEGLNLEEIDFQKKKRKDRVLSNMKFIGHLFLRQLLSAKIIGSVIQDLTSCDQADVLPEEPMIECICELLSNIGYTLESTAVGKAAVTAVCGRLLDLKQRQTELGKGVYSKRIQFGIQDILDMRCAGWTKKTFKASAKTKDEIRRAQEKEMALQARGKEVSSGEVQIAGARPMYVNSC